MLRKLASGALHSASSPIMDLECSPAGSSGNRVASQTRARMSSSHLTRRSALGNVTNAIIATPSRVTNVVQVSSATLSSLP